MSVVSVNVGTSTRTKENSGVFDSHSAPLAIVKTKAVPSGDQTMLPASGSPDPDDWMERGNICSTAVCMLRSANCNGSLGAIYAIIASSGDTACSKPSGARTSVTCPVFTSTYLISACVSKGGLQPSGTST